ncbi:TIGR03084 family protein [Verrucosispora sp. ts21]|uniref:TIGR03084 family metal-binding protein n=1 Tax=Verrucosispora sp. ts21 TaxID=2069341 RepID=UPI000C88B489|nr:TIGR03084 family metal-binding protein [Verrucosispora sp. ts21]PMR61720.1 TIGR03084 family protein [Verrucosispora sp. ts21]
MTQAPDVIADLTAESEALDAVVATLSDEQWETSTPAHGWAVRHQIAHLAATFRLAGLAAAQPAAFQQMTSRLSDDFDANVAAAMADFVVEPPTVLLSRWRTERATAEKALAAVPPGQMVPWLVRPLPAPVLAAAGMMEVFAHGRDVLDALGVRPAYTDRLGHLVGFAVRTWDFGYLARGRTAPDVQFRFEITAPSGALWEFGPPDANQRITGPAEDFCLLVTRRRHRDDLAVRAVGSDAEHWLDIAQAYRGPAGPGRRPGQFSQTDQD